MKYKNRVIKPDLDRKQYTRRKDRNKLDMKRFQVDTHTVDVVAINDALSCVKEYDDHQEEIILSYHKYKSFGRNNR